jgi:hypothetical protein
LNGGGNDGALDVAFRELEKLASILVVLAACTGDTSTAPKSRGRLERPRLATWVDRPQPCVIGVPFIEGQTWIGRYTTNVYSACGVNAQMYWPPGDTFNGNYAAWFTDYEGLVVGDSLTQFKVNFTNSNQEGPLEITFNKAVKNVSVTMDRCPGCTTDTVLLHAGHYMTALDSAGNELGRIDFDAGVRISEKTLAISRIRKVVVYPLVLGPTQNGSTPVEKVQHRVAFAVDSTCPPTVDPLLDHPDFKNGFDSLMAHSRVSNPDPAGRREMSMYSYLNSSTGEIMIDPLDFTTNNPCQVISPAPLPPQGWVYYAKIHTHPYFEGENVSFCPGITGPYNPRKNGGGSPGDWDSAVNREYVLTPEFAFRLDANTPVEERPYNPNMWKKGAMGCYSRSR